MTVWRTCKFFSTFILAKSINVDLWRKPLNIWNPTHPSFVTENAKFREAWIILEWYHQNFWTLLYQFPILFLANFGLFLALFNSHNYMESVLIKGKCSQRKCNRLFKNNKMTRSFLTCLYRPSWLGSCQAVGTYMYLYLYLFLYLYLHIPVGTSPSRLWAGACGRPARGSNPQSGMLGPGRSPPHVQSAPRNSSMNIS